MDAYRQLEKNGQNTTLEVVENIGVRFTYKIRVDLDTSYPAQSRAYAAVWRPAQLDWSTLFTLGGTKDNWAGKKSLDEAERILTERATSLLMTY